MRFINDHAKPTTATRTAVPITADELLNRIVDEIGGLSANRHKHNLHEYVCENLDTLLAEHPILKDDLSVVIFDTENLDCIDAFGKTVHGTTPTGIITLPNGLTALCVYAGGDWEYPIFFIIYWDGENIRAYIPTYGNCYNTICHSAFGSEDDCGEDWAKIKEAYKALGWDKDYDNYDGSWADAYYEIFGLNKATVGYNAEAMLEDISVSIAVSATNNNTVEPATNAEMYDMELEFESELAIEVPAHPWVGEMMEILGEDKPVVSESMSVKHTVTITGTSIFPDDTTIEAARKVFEQAVKEVYENPKEKQEYKVSVKAVRFVGIKSLNKHKS